VQARDGGFRHAVGLQLGESAHQPAARAEKPDITGPRRKGGFQRRVVGLDVMGGDGDGGPGIDVQRRQRLARLLPPIGDARNRRRRLGPFRSHQRGLELRLRAQLGDGERRGIAAHHNQAWDGVVGLLDRRFRPGRDFGGAQPRIAVADIDHRAPLDLRGQQFGERRIVGRNPLHEYLDARAAEQADIRPRTTLAIDEGARLAVLQAAEGVIGDVALHAAPGEIARDDAVCEHHLGPGRPGTAAVDADQGGERQGLAGVADAAESRSHVLRHSEQRPFGQGLARHQDLTLGSRPGYGFLGISRPRWRLIGSLPSSSPS